MSTGALPEMIMFGDEGLDPPLLSIKSSSKVVDGGSAILIQIIPVVVANAGLRSSSGGVSKQQPRTCSWSIHTRYFPDSE